MKRLAQNALFVFLTLLSLTSCTKVYQSKGEFYEYRIYEISSPENKKKVLGFLEKAYVPALKKMGVRLVGVLVNAEDGKDHSIHVIIPFDNLGRYSRSNQTLRDDMVFQKAAADFYAEPRKSPPYLRIDSSLFKAFSSMPVMELPKETVDGTPRLFELRVYESHNEDKAALKRDMFDLDGETQLMREVDMGPVFFGECLSGKNYPNLTYMLSASSMEENKASWQKFFKSPKWEKMKKMKKYKDTVSKIEKTYLKPVSFSGI